MKPRKSANPPDRAPDVDDQDDTRGVGRPEHQPDEASRALVLKYAQAGVRQEIIGAKLNISKKTLAKHYAEIIRQASAETQAVLGQTGLRVALGAPAEYLRDSNGTLARDGQGNPIKVRDEIAPDKALLIFLLKTRLGLKETMINEIVDHSDDNPEFDTAGLSDEERAARAMALLERARARRVGRLAINEGRLDAKSRAADVGAGKQGGRAGVRRRGRGRKD